MNYRELPTKKDKTVQAVIKELELRGPEHCAFFDACCLDQPSNQEEVELILTSLIMKKVKDGVNVFILTNPDWFQLLAGQVLISLEKSCDIYFLAAFQSADALSKIPEDLRRDYEKVCDAAECVFAITQKAGNKVYFLEPLVRWCGYIIRYANPYYMNTLNEYTDSLGQLYKREFINLRQRKRNEF